MRDLVGNPLANGQMVEWRSHGLIGHIIDIDEALVATAEERRPRIVIAIAIPLELPHGASPANFCITDIVRVVDPKATAIVDGMLARREGKPQ